MVGFREHRVLLMPLGPTAGLHVGCEVTAGHHPALPFAGPAMLGRVLDALGRPIDGLGALPISRVVGAAPTVPHPLRRQRIRDPFVTGVRALDAFTPVGRGQRLGLFAGSGVGKSTLMGMIARGCEADVIVVALVGERGREVREFIEKDLGPAGLRRAVVVAATSDTPAPLRLRAAFTATAIAEALPRRGQERPADDGLGHPPGDGPARDRPGPRRASHHAWLTRPPSSRPAAARLLERTGAGEVGAITALYTVLVEGDDMNEPVADAVRGILDGHLVLSRQLAHFNHYPAIDVLESVSRLTRDVCAPAEVALASRAREHLALYRKNEDLISIGAYQKGGNPALDEAIQRQPALRKFLCQPTGGIHRACRYLPAAQDPPCMKRFKFILRSVGVVRAHQKQRAREAWAAAVRVYDECAAKLGRVRARKAQV